MYIREDTQKRKIWIITKWKDWFIEHIIIKLSVLDVLIIHHMKTHKFAEKPQNSSNWYVKGMKFFCLSHKSHPNLKFYYIIFTYLSIQHYSTRLTFCANAFWPRWMLSTTGLDFTINILYWNIFSPKK